MDKWLCKIDLLLLVAAIFIFEPIIKTKNSNVLMNCMNKLLIVLIKYMLNDIMKGEKNDL